MPKTCPPDDSFIYAEMMTHPVLFAHPAPAKIAIFDSNNQLIIETLKHPNIKEVWCAHTEQLAGKNSDKRLRLFSSPVKLLKNSFDVIMLNEINQLKELTFYFNLLKEDGILIQVAGSPFEMSILKKLQKNLKNTGFTDIQLLSFAQPTYPTGWRAAFVAVKNGLLQRAREIRIYNKPFPTLFYNFDVHCAAFVLPQFMHEEFTMEES